MMISFAVFIKTCNSYYPFQSIVPNEMVVSQGIRVEEVDVELCFTYPAAHDEWVGKVIICHCPVIDPKDFVDFDLRSFNFLEISGFSPEYSEPKFTVI
jgi:hypothetical protein